MDLRACGREKVAQLVERGVAVLDPFTVDVGQEVDPARISTEGVVIYPGCRIYGAKTVISPGVKLGAEGPVTLEDCRLGSEVELRGGYFRQSVLLARASVGSGAQVREGCLLEEEATVAHCVGLKQTILFPFATLGSLINFCDCLLAGGTSRKDHSEVGSSYVHFNFTPDGDKATPSLFGDVPRGVMLNQPPIFLGGQGGTVGPVRVEFGTVVAAGCILRRDVLVEGRLVVVSSPPGLERAWRPRAYRSLTRVVRNNVIYLANLAALEQWYEKVRRPFLTRLAMGAWLLEGALEVLTGAKQERVRQLMLLAEKVPTDRKETREFRERVAEVGALFLDSALSASVCAESAEREEEFLREADPWLRASDRSYIEAVQSLPSELSVKGTAWLNSIVDAFCRRVEALLPGLGTAESRAR